MADDKQPIIIKRINKGHAGAHGGAWKVAFDKATMTKMGTDKMKEKGMDTNNAMDSASKMLQDMNIGSDTTNLQDTLQ